MFFCISVVTLFTNIYLLYVPQLYLSSLCPLQVFIKRVGEKISLIVDGISAQSKRIDPGRRQDPPLRAVLRRRGSTFTNGKTSFHKYTETKISGVIVSHRLTVTQAPGSGGFVGCVKDLKLNEALAGRPTHSQGTVPCFQQQLQPGAYFSGLGGHIAIGRFTVFHCPTDYLLVFLLLDSVVTVVWFIE